jgi:hydrogenase/urease accessory protein HupE
MMRLVLLTLVLLFAGGVRAHELSIAEMDVRQLSSGEFVWQWTASGVRPASDALAPEWPDGCIAEQYVLRCANGGLNGTLRIAGLGKRYSAAVVRIFWADGQVRVHTMTSAQPAVRLYGSADDERGMGEIASAYVVLGVEHILEGIDHLLFVLALLFLVGFERRLIWTITAFTLAHSVTLALSVLGWLTLRSPPVEATIALSIVLVAAEALRGNLTLSRRWPAVVAFIFGLVHGLGFAGALKEIGLPQNHLSVALVTFNVGVELGQLLVLAVAYSVYRAFASVPVVRSARVPTLYAIGGVAAYWSIGRVIGIIA